MTDESEIGAARGMHGNEQTLFFYSLTPERVLSAVEAGGYRCTGRCLTLNSMENRVYEVEIEGPEDTTSFVIAKFYRPGRWTKEQILEEHQFLADLQEREVPVVAPLPFADGSTLLLTPEIGIWYALFPKARGRTPEELTDDQFQWLGRLLARMHNVGQSRESVHRVHLTPQTYGVENLEWLERNNILPIEVRSEYNKVVREIVAYAAPLFAATTMQRIHGDCHPGNILLGSEGFFFVDFDDMVVGPPVQDIWLLISGRDTEGKIQLDCLLEGYEQMRKFDRSSLKLIEPLRALRYLHFSAWIARRWQDPAFQRTFPHFGSSHYWSGQLSDLREQLALFG